MDQDSPESEHPKPKFGLRNPFTRRMSSSEQTPDKERQRTAARELAAIRRPLEAKEVHDPLDLISSWIRNRQGNSLLALGENNHLGEGVLKYEPVIVEELHKLFKVQTVFLEENQRMMPLVDKFYTTGIIPPELKHYLIYGFVRKDVQGGYTYKYDLIIKCHELGIPVRFIDQNSLPDRNSDWANKINSELGDEIKGLHILIAGYNHIFHTKLLTDTESPTTVNTLDQIYKDHILSVKLQTGHPINPEFVSQEYLHIKFLDDLTSLDKQNTPSAILLKGSPYENRRDNAVNFVIASDAYDIMVNIPGQNLFKESES